MVDEVQSVFVMRRQSGLVPSQLGAAPATSRVTLMTHSSALSAVAPARVNTHQRAPSPDGGSWLVQLEIPSPVSRSPSPMSLRGAATPGGSGRAVGGGPKSGAGVRSTGNA